MAQNATAARAAGYGDADYSLIWFTTYYPDELARDSQCAHNVWHNLLILLMAPAHYYWFRAAPRSDGRWFIPVVIAPMLNRPRTRSRESTMRRCASFFFSRTRSTAMQTPPCVSYSYVCVAARARESSPPRDLQFTQYISELWREGNDTCILDKKNVFPILYFAWFILDIFSTRGHSFFSVSSTKIVRVALDCTCFSNVSSYSNQLLTIIKNKL